jgi:glutathione peroxidase-family protein
MASLHDFKGKTLGGGTRSNPTDGTEFDFAQLKGKVVLINNVATM